ncbi:MAG: glycosyltransferase, partial [Clostridia bacterium]|nr:glycosyltransferase [Clostridia bacterium]
MFSQFGLPDSCAAATRVMNLARLLRELGHEVGLLGVAYAQGSCLRGEHDGMRYSMLQANACQGLQAGMRVRDLDRQIRQYLSAQEKPWDMIILSNVYSDHVRTFNEYARRHGTRLAVNAVEWYALDDERFRGPGGVINLLKNRAALCWKHVRMGNIIAISTLLEQYYAARGCRTVVIPTIVDMKEYQGLVHHPHDRLQIAYAGSPARKDYLLNVVRALTLLTEAERSRLELHLYGPTPEQLRALGMSAETERSCGDALVCHGRIPYDEVKARIAEADFTVLLRPDRRYANAGFPTKVGESMACGTPVICNLTSDLQLYVHDGKNGIVVQDESAQACAAGLRRALDLSDEMRADMRCAARLE